MNGYKTTLWSVLDEVALLPMIRDCLRVNYEAGADMEPTDKNALALFRLGVNAAQKGEPCLLASTVDGWTPVGYTLWCDLGNPLGLDYRGRVLYGLGTYVLPTFQRKGLAHHLRNVAEAMAARQGFTKVVGVAYHEAGLQSVLARGYRIAGQHVEKVLA